MPKIANTDFYSRAFRLHGHPVPLKCMEALEHRLIGPSPVT